MGGGEREPAGPARSDAIPPRPRSAGAVGGGQRCRSPGWAGPAGVAGAGSRVRRSRQGAGEVQCDAEAGSERRLGRRAGQEGGEGRWAGRGRMEGGGGEVGRAVR